MGYKCRAEKTDKKLCRNPVKSPDTRCYLHIGLPAGHVGTPAKRSTSGKRAPQKKRAAKQSVQRTPARPASPLPLSISSTVRRDSTHSAPSPQLRTWQESEQLEQAVNLCSEIVSDGGAAVIAERATTYVTDETWKRLVKNHKRGGCDDLAELARSILKGKERLHAGIGQVAGGLLGFFRRPRIERMFAQELVSKIPLPVDGKLAAAARGLQVAGVYVCIVRGQQMSSCACLLDILKVEGKVRLKRLMENSLEDWQCLPRGLWE